MPRAEAKYILTADDQTGAAFDSVKRKFAQTARTATRAATGIAAAGIAGFGVMAKQAIDAADETGKLARELGVSTELLSEMQGVLELTGGSFQGYTNGIRRMQRSIDDFAEGSATMVDAFDAIGVSLEDLEGLNTEQQIELITGALAGMEDVTTRNAKAADIFGRSAKDMLRLVDAGAENVAKLREEQKALGNSLTKEGAEGAEAFNDAMTRLGQTLRGVVLTSVTDNMDSLVSSMQSAVKLIPPFIQAIGAISRVVRGTGEFVGIVGAAAAAAGRGEFSAAGSLLNTPVSELGAPTGGNESQQEANGILREIRDRVGPARAG